MKSQILFDTSSVKLCDELYKLGSKYLFIYGDWARNYFLASIKLESSHTNKTTTILGVRALANIGYSYSLEGEHINAIKYYDSVIAYKSIYPIFPLVFVHIRLGESYTILGEWNQAHQNFLNAEHTFLNAISNSQAFDPEFVLRTKKQIYDLYIQWANSCLIQNRYDEAIIYCQNGFKLVRNVSNPEDTLFRVAGLYLTMGNAYLEFALSKQKSNYSSHCILLDSAMISYKKASEYYFGANDYSTYISSLNNVATILYIGNRFSEAKSAYLRAINLNKNAEGIYNPEQLKYSYLNIGSSYYRLNALDSANYYYTLLLRSLNGDTTIVFPPIQQLKSNYEFNLLFLGSFGRLKLAMSSKKIGSDILSQASYDSLAKLLNHMRGNLINDLSKVKLAQKSRLWIPDAVIDMASLYYQNGNPEFKDKVFHFIEHSKAFSLLEASRLNNAGALLTEHLQKLQNEISKLQLDAINNKDLEAEISSKQHDFFDRLQKEAPAYFALKYQGIRNHPKQVQDSILEADQTMLEYFIHDSLLLILAIQKDTFLLDTVHIAKRELFNRVSEFRAHMNPVDSTGRISDAKQSSFCKQSFELYQLLVGRIKNRIRLNQRLVIIPDGSLNDLSFDALLCQWEPDQLHIPDLVKNEQFLVQQHAISYCFSASLLEEMKKGDDKPSLNSSLALFAPDFHKSSALLPYMNYQKEEIHKIQMQIPSSHLVKLSSKENFIRVTKTHAFMHIATHGFESPDPDQSFIAFNQTSIQPDTSQFLYLKELYHIPMRQELLTLTACETALGPLQEGEGNISLARGFAYAGVKAMITTLWKIQTNGASKIIPEFYRHYLVNGKPKDVALSESKRAYLKAGKAVYPDEWAGLILIGNAAEFAPKPKVFPYLWILFGTAMIITFIYFLKRKKSWFA
ncbi:MAG: CHAT domain-containing protein [Saprospiraceae bacterium]|nr:CHAT domain-containing protein [Saprospiraceae bacterium]